MNYKILKKSTKSLARLGQLTTAHGVLKTPFFMPIATKGTVKSLTYEDLQALNASIVLSNTYHLMLRPGSNLIKRAGGLHQFMNWNKPILTDSGGFQVFSLSHIRKLTSEGVEFRSHIDGRKIFMRPEDSIKIQLELGSDIVMVLDECVELPADRHYLEQSIDLTTAWAKRCRKYFNTRIKKYPIKKRPLLFGIVQGGLENDLRQKSAQDLVEIGFDGYAVGGLSVGETEKQMYETLEGVINFLPENQPRYLMGVGKPENIINAVKRGVDMFDCVIPTREARHGRLYLWNNGKVSDKTFWNEPKSIYQTVNIKAEKYSQDFSPINKLSKFPILRNYHKAYLRHLFAVQEPLAIRLATLNNLEFYLTLMEKIRNNIK